MYAILGPLKKTGQASSAMGDLLVCAAKLWNFSVQESWPAGMATSRLDVLGMDVSPSERLGFC